MTTNEIKAVVDMVEEVARQYQLGAGVLCIAGVVFAALGFVVLVIGIVFESRNDGFNFWPIILSAAGGIIVFISLILICVNIGNYIVPLCGLIGK